MIGFNPALRIPFKSYFKPLNLAIIWEVMGIGIPASIESVLFNGGKLLTQMFVSRHGNQRYRRELYCIFYRRAYQLTG